MARFAGTALTDYFSTPDFTQVGKTGMMGQSLQRNTATKAEGLVHGAGIDSMEVAASAGFNTHTWLFALIVLIAAAFHPRKYSF